MKHKPAVLIIALTVALLLSLVKIVWTEKPQADPFITKLPDRVFLPSQDSEEEFRSEKYAEDGFTRISAERQYRDGVTEIVTFRKNGTLSGYTQLYAGAEGHRQLKSNAVFDEAGRFFVSHQVYRQDGTLERTGEKLRDGRYQSVYYWEDGKTVARQRFFDSQRKFASENVFNQAGVRLATRTAQNDNLQMTLYREDGTISVSYVKSMFGEQGKVYAADGNTLVFEFEQDPWTARELHYNEQGVPVQARTFVRMAGSTDVVVLNQDGSLRFKQIYRHAKRGSDGPIEPILSRVMEAKNQSLYRTIEVDKDGKPTQVTYPVTGGGRIVKQLADGKLVTRQVIYDSANKIVAESKDTGEVEKFDSALFQDPPHAQRPTSFVDENAPPMVYDYK